MHILFLGKTPVKTRTEVLIHEAIKNGHKVTVISNPLASLLTPFMSINTIHVHSFQAALLVRMVSLALKNTVLLWTISDTPTFTSPFFRSIFQRFLQFISTKLDTIYSPTRTQQYLLLTLYKVKSQYIPDGYSLSGLQDIRPAVYSLRKEQYGVVLTQNTEELKQLAKLFKALKTNKKLVLFSERTHPGFMNIDLPLASRGAQSLIRQAAFVICTDPIYSSLALQAMDSGRTIIATTDPLHEELFGTTANYYEKNDSTELLDLLQKAIKPPIYNTRAQIRAKNHFSWDTIVQEYMKAYKHSAPVLVPFDSIIARNSFQTAE